MPSQTAIPGVRAPQRRRGHERVAALLESAAACFVEKGYDAATMTEIAARAGASIGSLYQFFPTKVLLAQALIAQYAEALHAEMDALAARAAAWSADELGTRLIQLLVDFRRARPAFAVLAEAVASTTLPRADGLAIRKRLRAQLQDIFAARPGAPPAAELRAAAVVALQLMKAAVALSVEPGLAGRRAALAQLRTALQLYLRHALGG
jgi:AcrR family transcriptional regulator